MKRISKIIMLFFTIFLISNIYAVTYVITVTVGNIVEEKSIYSVDILWDEFNFVYQKKDKNKKVNIYDMNIEDTWISNGNKITLVNKSEKDINISIHCNDNFNIENSNYELQKGSQGTTIVNYEGNIEEKKPNILVNLS